MKFRPSSFLFMLLPALFVFCVSTSAFAEDKVIGGKFTVRFKADPKGKTWTNITTFEIDGDGKADVDKKAIDRYKAHLISLSLLPSPNYYLPFLGKDVFKNHWDLFIDGYYKEKVNCPKTEAAPAISDSATASVATATGTVCTAEEYFEEVGETLDTSEVTLDTITPQEAPGIVDLLIWF